MNLMNRALLGGLAGGLMTGDLGGVAGGAATGMLGGGMLNKYGRGLGVSDAINKGLGYGIRGAKMGSRAGAGMYYGKSWAGKLAGNSVFGASNRVGAGLVGARNFMSRNAMMTNRVAGASMAAMGTAAGAYIGSSVLNSNNRRW